MKAHRPTGSVSSIRSTPSTRRTDRARAYSRRRAAPHQRAHALDRRARVRARGAGRRPGLRPLAEQGCGVLTAAKLIGEIAGIGRFTSDAKLARLAGSAPIQRPRSAPTATASTAAATGTSRSREGRPAQHQHWRATEFLNAPAVALPSHISLWQAESVPLNSGGFRSAPAGTFPRLSPTSRGSACRTRRVCSCIRQAGYARFVCTCGRRRARTARSQIVRGERELGASRDARLVKGAAVPPPASRVGRCSYSSNSGLCPRARETLATCAIRHFAALASGRRNALPADVRTALAAAVRYPPLPER